MSFRAETKTFGRRNALERSKRIAFVREEMMRWLSSYGVSKFDEHQHAVC